MKGINVSVPDTTFNSRVAVIAKATNVIFD